MKLKSFTHTNKKFITSIALICAILYGQSALAWIQLTLRLAPVAAQGENGVPVGAIFFIKSGTCPMGYAEDTDVNGKTVLGTLEANANVGGTGGNDNITPTGTNEALTFTGSALGTHAHGTGTLATSAHSGTAVADHASHTHTYTDVVNHVHVQSVNSATTGGSNGYGIDTSTNTSTASSYSTANPTGGVATGTTNGPSATLTHSVTQPSAHTLSGSSESVSAGTPSGTINTPAFTGTQFDNRSAFIRLIACRKT
jgi:hypothetical protein